MKRDEIFWKIAVEIQDKPFKNIQKLVDRTGIRWETVRNSVNILKKIGIVTYDKQEKVWFWNSVPLTFWQRCKAEQEEYIEVLERRMLRYKYEYGNQTIGEE